MNMETWEALGTTDPAHTKDFKRPGGFSGTAIKPMWAYKRMTEQFGPCGVGWGVNEPSFQLVPANSELLVYCTVSVWHGSKDTVIFGVGGDKVICHIKANEKYNRPERWDNDDEAFKKSFTDAITNALKMIGVGADVHMGMFDDNKYVNSAAAHFAPKPPSSANMKRQLDTLADEMVDADNEKKLTALWRHWSKVMNDERWPGDNTGGDENSFRSEVLRRFSRRKAEIQQAEVDLDRAALEQDELK